MIHVNLSIIGATFAEVLLVGMVTGSPRVGRVTSLGDILLYYEWSRRRPKLQIVKPLHVPSVALLNTGWHFARRTLRSWGEQLRVLNCWIYCADIDKDPKCQPSALLIRRLLEAPNAEWGLYIAYAQSRRGLNAVKTIEICVSFRIVLLRWVWKILEQHDCASKLRFCRSVIIGLHDC